MVFTGADDNRLQNYKITNFTIFMRRGGGSGAGASGAGVWI